MVRFNDVYKFCVLWYTYHIVIYLDCSKINKNNQKLMDLRKKVAEETNKVKMNSRAECLSVLGQVSPVNLY